MKKYIVYVEIFGKKFKTEVEAYSEEHAEDTVKKKMIFHKVEELPSTGFDNNLSKLKGLKKVIDSMINLADELNQNKGNSNLK